MISASSIPRLLQCPGSARLPQRDYNTAYADQGTDFHAEMEAAADAGDHEALPPKIAALIGPGDKTTTEAAFAYDVASDTGRGLGHIAREYAGLTLYEIPGTPDLVIHHADGTFTLIDYKGHERVEAAAKNTQLATYALMICRALNIDEIRVVIFYRSDSWMDVAQLGPLELDAHAARLRKLAVQVASPDAPLAIGRGCKYCGAFNDCPKQKDLAREVDLGLMSVRVEAMIPFSEDEDAAAAFDLHGRVQMLANRIKAALIMRAKERPIPLGDGRVFGEHEKNSPTQIDADVAYTVIRERLGQKVADEAVSRKVTQIGIERACGKDAKKNLLKAIEDRGGIKRDRRVVVEEYTVKP